jgi:hypothetical protein
VAPKKRPPPSKSKKANHGAADFRSVFSALKRILAPYEKRLRLGVDKPAYYYPESRDLKHRGKPVFFAGVRLGRAYVSYYLMPVYADPSLLRTMSPELKKRMQGKACFNFSTVDPALFGELRELTARGLACFHSKKFLEMLRP